MNMYIRIYIYIRRRTDILCTGGGKGAGEALVRRGCRADDRRHHLGFRVQGSGFRVQGAGFRVQGSGCRVQVAGFRVQGAGFRVQGSGFRFQGSGSRVQGPGSRVYARGPRLEDADRMIAVTICHVVIFPGPFIPVVLILACRLCSWY